MDRRDAAANAEAGSHAGARVRSACVVTALCGVAFAGLLWLAFPPLSVWWVAPLIVSPLVVASTRWDRRYWLGGVVAGVATLPVWLYEQSWTRHVSEAGFVPLGLVLSVYPGLFVWGMARVVRSSPGVPVWAACGLLWGALEMIRGRIAFGGYPWFLVGHPVVESPVLAAAGSVVGASGVSVLVAGLGGAIGGLFAGRARESLIGAGVIACVWGALSVVGTVAWPIGSGQADAGASRPLIAAVQTNVPQDVRGTWEAEQRVEDMLRFLELTRRASERGASVIVWPETMFPGYYLDRESLAAVRRVSDRFPDLARFVDEFARALTLTQGELSAAMVVGARTYDGLDLSGPGGYEPSHDATFNSAVVIEGGEITNQRYDKVHLTPFGEVMPYISAWPWLESRVLSIGLGASGMRFDLDAGAHAVLLEVGGLQAATPICFEATMAAVCRRLVVGDGSQWGPAEADLLMNLTNDGWFGGFDAGRAQHLLSARWRSVELGLPMLRAANTGISCLIDARGRVVSQLPPRQEGVLVVELGPGRGWTMYRSTGEAMGWASLTGGLGLIAWTVVGRRWLDARGSRADTSLAGK